MENLEADMICLSKEYKEKHSPGGRKMRCPYCGSENSRVIDSRHSEDNNSIRLVDPFSELTMAGNNNTDTHSCSPPYKLFFPRLKKTISDFFQDAKKSVSQSF